MEASKALAKTTTSAAAAAGSPPAQLISPACRIRSSMVRASWAGPARESINPSRSERTSHNRASSAPGRVAVCRASSSSS
jgi:hypothetical protein